MKWRLRFRLPILTYNNSEEEQMIKRALILLIIFSTLLVVSVIHAMTSGQVIGHETKKFIFQSY